jgi:toxin ParE1/3/4
VGRPFVTGRINYTPRARQQLHDLDEWIVAAASKDVAQSYLARVIDHIEDILVFPLAGRPRDDLRPGIRTTTYKDRTLIAYDVDDSTGESVITILGVFHGGQNWEAALSAGEDSEEA